MHNPHPEYGNYRASRDWSAEEVAAVVADYREMLRLELLGQEYNKAEHNRHLRLLLNDRSAASVEFKHANISAALIDSSFLYIRGYKQRVNFQQSLRPEIQRQILDDDVMRELAGAWANARVSAAVLPRELNEVFVPAPVPQARVDRVNSRPAQPRSPRLGIGYLAVEARNASLGLEGEKFVLEVEERSLRQAGAKHLANRIEHVARTQGDGLGYDILSFEPDGRERLIEVKTTGLGKLTPFFASKREVLVSQDLADRYHLYRLFRFRDAPQIFVLKGAVRQTCNLDPTQFRATLR